MQSRQPGRGTTEPEKQPRSAAATAVREPEDPPGKTRLKGRWAEGETLTRPDNNRRGGEDGGRDQASAERPPGASGTLRRLLLVSGFLPSSVLVRLTTSLLATRPGSARFRGRRRNSLQRLETPAASLPSMRALRACPVRRRGGTGARDTEFVGRSEAE